MAYDRKKVFEQAKDAITKHKLFFMDDVIAFLPCSKPTFYDYFRPDSNELNELKELMELNRIELKVSLRSKWYKSNAPALQMALYKLIADESELVRLSVFRQDMNNDDKNININIQYPPEAK